GATRRVARPGGWPTGGRCLRPRRAGGRPRGGRRGVLHDEGAGTGDGVGPRHRGACRRRYGGGGMGGHRSRGRGGLQDVLPLLMTRVLVVDDEPGLRQSLGLLLADAGYQVTAEGDGAKALERALAEPFDLVLCDVRMPAMDGRAFLRAYTCRGGSALVIMITAYGGEGAAR